MPQVNTDDVTVQDVAVVLNDIAENSRTEEIAASLLYDVLAGLKPKTRELLKEQMESF